MSDAEHGCRFCLENNLLVDTPLFDNAHFYALGSIDPMVPIAGMIIPRRHSETPFEMLPEEWLAFGDILAQAKQHFAELLPDGFTLGWNVGAVAGQHVFHTHLHIIPRFKDAPNAGVGIRRIMRTPDWDRDA
ncbi:MAG: HIT family protein [Alphaproteobacteria bacterium]|jgi:histidine triad (HIT) family protein|uniref:HIT family protein n=1 Tax=Devosia sp. XGJD_8 TaxID=3391187 RepID=UPI001D7E626A|nr:HIT family protein [Alphaproteobacteria bacterium]MBU1559447.1 HIT family protein [Alphaproteobacteria bacterium]MBU2301499.1 HIT family protein [Alphaproteobacteria bacterium]MBU2369772.1 HIT family protein [Alphaproteobacteria bacterium]